MSNENDVLLEVKNHSQGQYHQKTQKDGVRVLVVKFRHIFEVHAIDSCQESEGYKDDREECQYFQNVIVSHPKMKTFDCPVAKLCGMNMKLYFIKAKKGLGQHYREAGEEQSGSTAAM